MSKAAFLFFIIALMAAGCSSTKSSSPDATPTVTPESAPDNPNNLHQSSLKAEEFHIVFQANPTLNSYQMNISWPKSAGRVAFKYTQGTVVSEPPVVDGHHVSFPVTGGVRIRLELKSVEPRFEDDDALVIKLNPPQDILIKDKLHLKANTYWSANRVAFTKGGEIVTHGFDLVVEATTLTVAPDAGSPKLFQILTTENSSAHKVDNAKEYSNSKISLTADKASGFLHIGMVGINGQNGASGRLSEPGENGGATGDLRVRFKDSGALKLRILSHAGTGGKGSLGSNSSKRGATGTAGAVGVFDFAGVVDAKVE